MNLILLIIIIILILIIIYELIITFIRKNKRRNIFKLAQERSKVIGKPLLVIGDPYNGLASIMTGSDYTPSITAEIIQAGS